jgi:hypothetical protein
MSINDRIYLINITELSLIHGNALTVTYLIWNAGEYAKVVSQKQITMNTIK